MTQSRDLGYIDANVQVGPATGGARGAPIDLVRRERESHGIRMSLVRHRTALLHTPSSATGCSSTRGLTILVSSPSPCCLSTGRRTRPAGPLASRVGGFWLEGLVTPGRSLSAEPVVGPPRRPVVRCSCRSRAGDRRRRSVATEGLGVPVVLTGSHYTTSVEDLAAARRYQHLHLDTSSMAHFRAIETDGGRARRRARPVRERIAVPGHPVVDQRDPRGRDP